MLTIMRWIAKQNSQYHYIFKSNFATCGDDGKHQMHTAQPHHKFVTETYEDGPATFCVISLTTP